MAMITITRDGGLTMEEMDEALLVKKTGEVDNENEHTTWVEYWLDGKLVHRSVGISLKKGVAGFGEIGKFQ